MMKRFTAVLFAALFLVMNVAFAEGLDFASMSDEELHSIIGGARNELAKRELVAGENTVLFEENGVSVYLTGEHDVYGDDTLYLELGAVVVNDTEYSIGVDLESVSINGWIVYGGGVSETEPGKRQEGTLDIDLSDAEISSYEEIEDIEFEFYVYDEETYDTLFSVDPVTVHFNAE